MHRLGASTKVSLLQNSAGLQNIPERQYVGSLTDPKACQGQPTVGMDLKITALPFEMMLDIPYKLEQRYNVCEWLIMIYSVKS